MTMTPIALVETTRGFPDTGYTVENVHRGSVAVVNSAGELLWWAGDPDALTFSRSAIKPFQALPFLQADGPARFGFSMEEVALLCASHSGEPRHVATVESMLAKIGLDDTCLACGWHVPLYYESVGLAPPPGQQWRQVQHNCSGKHSGSLGWCRLHDSSLNDYLERDHPLQQAVRTAVADVARVAPASMAVGLDGCSAPNYALPLSRLAMMVARLASGAADPLGAPMATLYDAMTTFPDLVSGEGRCDLAYMQAGGGDWVSKVGADAVQTIGVRSAGLGIAIKVADGAARSLQTATYAVLDQLGLLDDHRRAALEHYRAPVLRSAKGAPVGEIRAVFTLQKAL
jgi:L-asparaginase II